MTTRGRLIEERTADDQDEAGRGGERGESRRSHASTGVARSGKLATLALRLTDGDCRRTRAAAAQRVRSSAGRASRRARACVRAPDRATACSATTRDRQDAQRARCSSTRRSLGVGQLAVDVRRDQRIDRGTARHGQVSSAAADRTASVDHAKSATSRCRPECSASSAISAYENSSTSRNHTACRKASGNSSMAACSSGRQASRPSSSASGVGTGAAPPVRGRRPAPDRPSSLSTVTRVARAIPRAIPRGVVKDGEQPGPQIRSRLEAVGGTKRLEIRVLHQIFGIGRHPRQAERRPIQAVHRCQRLGLKRRPARGHPRQATLVWPGLCAW